MKYTNHSVEDLVKKGILVLKDDALISQSSSDSFIEEEVKRLLTICK